MLKKLLVSIVALAIAGSSYAQLRYRDEVFREQDIEIIKDVVYARNINFAGMRQPLTMDIYHPKNDTAQKRPVILIAHGGSFLPGVPNFQPVMPLGTKTDFPIVELCKRYAKRGYVAVAFTYRTGWNPVAPADTIRAEGIIRAAWRAMIDGKDCVRFFRDNALNKGNQYKIDEKKIVVAGSQAGGYIPVHMAYFDKPSELRISKVVRPVSKVPFIDTADSTLGGFDSGSNTNVPSSFALGITLGGAVGDSTFIEGGEVPMLSMHGTQDDVTPYGTAIVTPRSTGLPIIEVSGGSHMLDRANRLGNQNILKGLDNTNLTHGDKGYFVQGGGGNIVSREVPGLYSFVGAGFQPFAWYANITTNPQTGTTAPNPNRATDSVKAVAYLDTVIWFTTRRMVKTLNLPTSTSMDKALLNSKLTVYPNPTAERIIVETGDQHIQINGAELYDYQGRVLRLYNVKGTATELDLSAFPTGNYILHIFTNKGDLSKPITLTR
jgi:acetyl esterase/lipase